MSGGAGRMVHLRHANGYETEYLHLSSIGVHVGQHVHQGDVLGRVGASGLATGPHLDFRIRKNGVFVNPVTAAARAAAGRTRAGRADGGVRRRARSPARRDPPPAVATAADTTAADHQP